MKRCVRRPKTAEFGIMPLFPRACGLADVAGQILVILAANTANPIDAVMYEMVQYAHKVDKGSLS